MVMVSGNPVFTTGYYGSLFVFSMIFFLIVFNPSILSSFSNTRVIIIFAVLFIQFFLQRAMFGSYSVVDFFNLINILAVGLIIAVYLKSKFIYLYVKVIYIFAVISLWLYFTFMIFPGLYYFTMENIVQFFELPGSRAGYSYHNNILIYTLSTPPDLDFYNYRNAGPFWEPGAFGIYLNLAIIINIFLLRNKWLSKINIILVIALLTTFSTSNWIIIFILLAGYYYFEKGQSNFGMKIAPLILAYVFFVAYETLPFLGEKIAMRNTTYENAIYSETKLERVGSFYRDTYLLMKNPLLGFGVDPRNKNPYYTMNSVLHNHRNNGTSDLLLIFGLPLGVYYIFIISQIYLVFGSHRSRTYNIYLFILVMLLGFSQIILLKAVFVILFWLAYFAKNTVKNMY